MDDVQSGPITRRGLLKIATTVSALALVGNIGLANGACAEPNPIQKENAHEGATDWQLTRTRVDKADGCRCLDIEGYCSKQSVAAGESLQIMVSTQPASKYRIEIFRTGYYGGRGARLMKTIAPSTASRSPHRGPIAEHARVPLGTSRRTDDPRRLDQRRLPGPAHHAADSVDKPYWQSYVVFIVRDIRSL